MATAKEKMDIIVSTKGTQTAKKQLGGVEKSIGSMAKGALAGVASFYALKKAYDIIIGSAAQFEKVGRQMDAVLKSTKNAAGMTKKELLNLADSFQNVTTYSNTSVMEAENLILTFTKIGKRIMPDAIETVLNMSTALGQDLKSSAIQVGKALNDPITGATALRRVGVSLTDQQIKQIKVLQENNDLFGAQKIILDELATEFGGAAKAGVNSFYGAVSQVTNIISDLGRSIGDKALPAISGLLGGIVKLMQVPLSKKIASERIEFNSLVGILTDVNSLQDTRNRAIKELQNKYGDYIGNINLETASVKLLKEMQENANRAFLEKIRLKSAEEEIAKMDTARVKILVDIFKKQKEINKSKKELSERSRSSISVLGDEITSNQLLSGTLEKNIIDLENMRKGLTKLTKIQNEFIGFLQEEGINLNDLHSKNEPIINDNDIIIGQNNKLIEQQMQMMGIGEIRTSIKVSPLIEYNEQFQSKTDESYKFFLQKYNKMEQIGNRFAGAMSGAIMQMAGSNKKSFQIIADAFKNMLIQMAAEMAAKAAIFGILNIATGGAFGLFQKGKGGGSGLMNFLFAQHGANFITDKPTLILAGEKGREHVNIQPAPINNVNSNSRNLTINMYGTYYQDVDHLAQEIADRSQLGFNKIAVN